ncbi:MAG TPA: ornithine cyclodeaminase family protein [Candidatus Angelobacter sp.]|nr:ornithine cyclodeaminase family protein [Candidatus Angelobacter sp.]
MLILSDDRLRKLLNPDQVIQAIQSAFSRGFSSVRMPVRTSLDLDGAVLLVMPCHDDSLKAAGVKLVSVSKKSGVNANYELLDATSGIALARMEANYLTDLRTAATSAVATDLLARKNVNTLGIFGNGRQAAAHFGVLPRVRNFKRFLVCGSGRSDVNAFCGKMKADHGIEIEPVTAEICARESDVICTCTTATEPLFDGRWLKPGTHLNLVGAFQPHTREVDDETVRRARVVVDTYDGCLSEAGDLLIPLQNGTVGHSHVIADLHEISSGKKAGRAGQDDITLFKSVGCALEDLVTAVMAYKQAAS